MRFSSFLSFFLELLKLNLWRLIRWKIYNNKEPKFRTLMCDFKKTILWNKLILKFWRRNRLSHFFGTSPITIFLHVTSNDMCRAIKIYLHLAQGIIKRVTRDIDVITRAFLQSESEINRRHVDANYSVGRAIFIAIESASRAHACAYHKGTWFNNW